MPQASPIFGKDKRQQQPRPGGAAAVLKKRADLKTFELAF